MTAPLFDVSPQPEGCASVEERDAGIVFAWCAAGMLAAGLGFALAVAGGLVTP